MSVAAPQQQIQDMSRVCFVQPQDGVYLIYGDPVYQIECFACVFLVGASRRPRGTLDQAGIVKRQNVTEGIKM